MCILLTLGKNCIQETDFDDNNFKLTKINSFDIICLSSVLILINWAIISWAIVKGDKYYRKPYLEI